MNIRYDRIIAWSVLLLIISVCFIFAINSDVENTSNESSNTSIEESNISIPEITIEENSETIIDQEDNLDTSLDQETNSDTVIEDNNSIDNEQEDISEDTSNEIVSTPPEEEGIRGPQGIGTGTIITLPPIKPADTFIYYTHYIHPNSKKYHNPIKINLNYEQQIIAFNLCLKYDVPYELMLGLWEKESCLNINIGAKQNKRSGRWYYGIGMIDIEYCSLHLKEKYNVALETPLGGLEGSIIIMKEKLNNYQNDWHKALMAYNQGNNSAERDWAKEIYTSQYSEHIVFIANNLISETNS